MIRPPYYAGTSAAACFWPTIVTGEFEEEELEDVKLEHHIASGLPAQVLLDAAADADLLVVGSRVGVDFHWPRWVR